MESKFQSSFIREGTFGNERRLKFRFHLVKLYNRKQFAETQRVFITLKQKTPRCFVGSKRLSSGYYLLKLESRVVRVPATVKPVPIHHNLATELTEKRDKNTAEKGLSG